MMLNSPEPAMLDQVVDALADIARTADAELTWSDHGSDMALRRIAADAAGRAQPVGRGSAALEAVTR